MSERPGERGKARARALSRRGNRKSRPLPSPARPQSWGASCSHPPARARGPADGARSPLIGAGGADAATSERDGAPRERERGEKGQPALLARRRRRRLPSASPIGYTQSPRARATRCRGHHPPPCHISRILPVCLPAGMGRRARGGTPPTPRGRSFPPLRRGAVRDPAARKQKKSQPAPALEACRIRGPPLAPPPPPPSRPHRWVNPTSHRALPAFGFLGRAGDGGGGDEGDGPLRRRGLGP